tara:strand:- start:3893 stop:4249 length:357 start_codon:yes stop_codon:yes gene_type:complete
MYKVVKNGEFNGVGYGSINAEIIAHHTQYSETFAKVEDVKVMGSESKPSLPTNDELMGFVRDYRVMLLAEVDWTQTLDCPLSDKKKSEFAAYRQALRDVPQNHPAPESIIWPEKPLFD